MKLLVATHNAGKVQEFAEMLADDEIVWLGLDDVGVTEDVAETGETFAENARLKARAYARMTGLLTLADDSGLEVAALNGRPGVYTARYGGEGLTHTQRYMKLLAEMTAVPWDARQAQFRCVIAVAAPDGRLLAEAEGICEGMIALEPAGDGGFGYDPIFYLPEYGRTMAQLPASEKHAISHRGQAFRKLLPVLRQIVGAN